MRGILGFSSLLGYGFKPSFDKAGVGLPRVLQRQAGKAMRTEGLRKPSASPALLKRRWMAICLPVTSRLFGLFSITVRNHVSRGFVAKLFGALYNTNMKAVYKMVLNRHVVLGNIERRGDQYILNPWTLPADEYNELVLAMHEEYSFALSGDGIVATPKPRMK
ncbi:hypothetical protein SDC9_153809 [bioreactor metagenome]|uniref:Uncharacterized protein n=1 Tax=bioreactor metagenome TaxID=1076179 RepID=A0A645F1M2_9ZZZZ